MSADACVILGGLILAGFAGVIWAARQHDQRSAESQKLTDGARDVQERSLTLLDRQQEVIARSLALLDRQEELLRRAELLMEQLENNRRSG
jgi:hypothetical protein